MKTKCANCEIVFNWKPTLVAGTPYCCAGCAGGGPCECDYDHLPARQPLIRHVRFEIMLPIETVREGDPILQISNIAQAGV